MFSLRFPCSAACPTEVSCGPIKQILILRKKKKRGREKGATQSNQITPNGFLIVTIIAVAIA